MAKQVATKEVVFAAADALAGEGAQPSTVLVQARTGGSYTTVKRLLEEWRDVRSASIEAVELPPDIEARGRLIVRELYSHAFRAAQAAVAEPVERALQARAMAEQQLVGAETEVARLEAVEQGLTQRVDVLNAQIRELELNAATLQATMAEKSASAAKLESLLAQSSRTLAERDSEVAELRASAKAVEHLQALLEDVKRGGRRPSVRKSA